MSSWWDYLGLPTPTTPPDVIDPVALAFALKRRKAKPKEKP